MNELPKTTWYVYRHSLPLPGPVLKSSETLLDIELDNGVWKASFQVSGRDERVEVTSTEVAQGVWRGETERFNFRWAHAPHGQNTVLIGETSRKGKENARRDFFVAVASKRTSPLPKRNRYYLAKISITSFDGAPNGWLEDVHIHCKTGSENKIKFYHVHGEERKLVTMNEVRIEQPDPYGLRVTGSLGDGPLKELGLWLLPGDGEGLLLATGYYFDAMHVDGKRSAPYDRHCTGGVGC